MKPSLTRYPAALCGIALSMFTLCYIAMWPASAAASDRELPIYSVSRDQKICAISFDAAWGNEDTDELITILEKYNVKTTFFVVGDWAEKYPESVKALFDAGHEVMSHSDDHAHYNDLTEEELLHDLESANARIAAVTGVEPTLIRCPYGEYDDTVVSTIRDIGMEPIQWDVDGSHIDASEYKRMQTALHNL